MRCLNMIRDSIMCHADDTPLYIGRLLKNVLLDIPKAGIGMINMCRNWSKLLAWSHAHSACFRSIKMGAEGYDSIDQYKSCPDGPRPWQEGKQK